MPTYEYRCETCKKTFEVSQNISDPPVEKCPECKGKVKRLISGGAFSLKGGGWYKDGYSRVANPRVTDPRVTDPKVASPPASGEKTEKKEKKTEVKNNGGKNKPT